MNVLKFIFVSLLLCLIAFAVVIFIPVSAFAAVDGGVITGWLSVKVLKWAGGAVGAFILGWILKKIPTGKWSKQLGNAGERHGQAVTIFCQKKVPLWNKIIEPVVIDTIGVVLSWVAGFIRGLKFDNKKE